ncbi:MAG: RluA family pseudouridine synthase [Patescibacteria group bacterium]|nr:RluA family pseudouridine synthase [Patescibacteria group bacterium]
MQILFQSSDFIAINKPAGVLVHGASYMQTTQPTVVDWVLKKFPQIQVVGDDPTHRPGVVHRLDKDTSGVLLIALTQKYFEYVKSLFQKHEIKKIYYAICAGIPKQKRGVIDIAIGIKSGTTKRTVFSNKMAKPAITEYEVEKTWTVAGETYSFIRVSPKTGRTHQIRVHLNYLGCPVIGDELYGGKRNAQRASRHMLHCFSMEFNESGGKRIYIEAPLPDDFKSMLSV